MWMKDGDGNWYMAGQAIMEGCGTPAECWKKDGAGNWVLGEGMKADPGPKGQSVVAEIEMTRVV